MMTEAHRRGKPKKEKKRKRKRKKKGKKGSRSPVVRKRPGIRPRDIHAVLPNGLEHLGQVAEVVVAPRRVEQLVRERDLVRLGKDGEAKLGDDNGPAPRAPDESSAVAVDLSRGSHLPHVV